MAGAGVITRFVGELAAALHGPRRVRAGLLAEVRDGLDDAAAAHRSHGVSALAAESRAVAEFGQVSDLAALYQAELTANQARRTTALLAVCFPMIHAMWELFGRTGHAWASAPEAANRLAETLDIASGVTAGAAVAGLLLLVRRARVRGAPRPLAIAVALLGGTAALVCGGMAVAMYLLAVPQATPVTVLAWALSGAALLAIISSTTRTLRLGLAPPPSRAQALR